MIPGWPFPRRTFLSRSTGVFAACAFAGVLSQDSTPVEAASVDLISGGDEIWDLHGHLAGLPQRTVEDRMHRLLEVADRMHIARLCVYMGLSFSYDPTPDEFRQENDDVLKALKVGGDRTLGFVYLNPKYPRESVEELNRCVQDGPMVGVKLWVATRADDANLNPIIQRATELQAVIFQHTWLKTTGNLPGESTPMELVRLAARHPDAKFICGHTGGNWELGIRAIRSSPNIAADLAGSDPVSGFTEMAVQELGADRILFGSDVPGRSFATQLGKVLGADLPEDSRRLILAGNLKRLLEPIMKQKGTSQ
jgi:predicted TIM-barrel fold metal-dependent hydrolase